jgi:hypothetical protein
MILSLKNLSIIIVMNLLFCPLVLSKRVNTEGNEIVTNKEETISSEWEPLLNPKTKEFWKEGNHIPDEGFLLFAQNPKSIKHAKFWLLRMETKAKILNQMQKTVEVAQKEMVEKGLMEDRYWQFEDLKKGLVNTRVTIDDLKQLNFYFLFSSTCPHCKGLAVKLKKIPKVRPLQVDNLKLMVFSGLEETTRATKETVRAYSPDGIVPIVVIHNPKTNVITKIAGNRPIGEYFLASHSLLKGEH